MAKSYRYNTIRFHSVIPPEECFHVADEERILIHIEMRKENDNYDNMENPAVKTMLNTLINYSKSSDFTPKTELSVADLKSYLEKIAAGGPNKEGMMTQYWQLDAEPVESMQYWEESERYLKDM